MDRGYAMASIVQLKVALRDVRPPVWRRVEVPTDFTLGDLHEVIQASLGWDNSHLHDFEIAGRHYSANDMRLEDNGWGETVHDATRFRLDSLVKQGVKSFSYTYDFGDDWRHKIDVEKVLEAVPDADYPRVVKGKGARPPEDVGGPPGYDMFREIIADPDHPEHGEMLEWAGLDAEDFDDTAFDMATANLRLEPLRASRRRKTASKPKAKPKTPKTASSPRTKKAKAPELPLETPGEPDDSPDALIDGVLVPLRDAPDTGTLPVRVLRGLVAHPGLATRLVHRVLTADAPDPDEQRLCVLLLDEARMDAEGNGARGQAFLTAFQSAIDNRMANDRSTLAGVHSLAVAYVRAGLTAPEALSTLGVAGDLGGLTDLAELGDPEDLEKVLDQGLGDALSELDDPYQLYCAFQEMLAGLPNPAKGHMAGLIARRSEALIPRLCLHWLLDPVAEIRLAAAEALAERLSKAPLERPLMALLVTARRWMPPDAARDALDRAVSNARAGLTMVDAGMGPEEVPVVEDIATSIPDGTGAQQFGALVRRGERVALAMVLLKTGHGVKDAFVLEESPEEIRDTFAKLRDAADMRTNLDALSVAVGAALGEGEALGRPPAPGLLDVLDLLPLDSFDPLPTTPEAWAERVDLDGAVAQASAQKRGRLVNESESWLDTFAMIGSWFEAGGDLETAVIEATSETAARRAVFDHLEERRAFWAEQCFRGALVLASDELPRHAQSFTAVGLALLDGRPLKKIPIMEWIVEATLDAIIDDGRSDGSPVDDPDLGPDDFDLDALAAQAPPPDTDAIDRLEDFLGREDTPEHTMNLSGLDGYLFSVAIPEPAPPVQEWLPMIWDGHQPPMSDPKATGDALNTILGRYTQIRTGLDTQDRGLGAIIWSDDDGHRHVTDWVRGFVEGMQIFEEEWDPLVRRAPEPVGLLVLGVDDPTMPPPPEFPPQELAAIRKGLPDQVLSIARTLWHVAHHEAAPVRMGPKVGRNDPCPCGSGKKYKKCCGQ
jgi:yecA family protein